MQTLFEIGFLLAALVPPAVVAAGAITLLVTPRQARPVATPARRAA
jgi:hypothetical protein